MTVSRTLRSGAGRVGRRGVVGSLSKARAVPALLTGPLGGAAVLAAPGGCADGDDDVAGRWPGLPVATEIRTGYSRDLFPLSIDATAMAATPGTRC